MLRFVLVAVKFSIDICDIHHELTIHLPILFYVCLFHPLQRSIMQHYVVH